MPEFESWSNFDGFSREERAFSGTGVYRATVTVAKKGTCLLDLGRVEVAAKVFVNGRPAAALWCKPYRCEIGHLLLEGANAVLGASGLLGPVTLTADPETLKGARGGLPLDRTHGFRISAVACM